MCIYIYFLLFFLTVYTRRSVDVSFAATSIHHVFTRTRTDSLGDGGLAKQANERTALEGNRYSKDGIYLVVSGFFEIVLLPI